MDDSFIGWILRYHSFRREPSKGELLALIIKKRLIEDLLFLKTMSTTSERGISMLTDSRMEEDAKVHCLSEVDQMQESVRDIQVLSRILKDHPRLSFFGEETVENIRKETRKLLGSTFPGLQAEIATVKKEAKTYQNIAKQLKEMLQGITNLDLALVQYSGDIDET